jgi:hypothetical protein
LVGGRIFRVFVDGLPHSWHCSPLFIQHTIAFLQVYYNSYACLVRRRAHIVVSHSLPVLLHVIVCRESAPMSNASPSSCSARRSTRSSYPPLSLADEQAASVLSQMEERDVAAALRFSLSSSWESDDDDAEGIEEIEEEAEEDMQEEKKEERIVNEAKDDWSTELHDIEVPLPRLRHLHNRPPPADTTPLQLLRYFLPYQLMEEFAEHTNNAAPHDWRHTTAAELYAFLGVHIYMGIDRLPSTGMYWSETFGHSFITTVFSRDRFKQILRYFRVVSAPVDAAPRNPIPHVRALAEKLNRSFAAHFTPTEHLTIDEAMCAWKGRAINKQYIPTKPHKYGYKIYCLASESYLLHFEIYEGKEDDPTECGATYDTVMRMIQQYQGQQLILFTDNWFTSPVLMSALQEKGIRMCGSVRSNRKGLPKVDINSVKSLKRGEWMQRQKDDITFAVWKDQRTMKLLYNHVSPNSTSSLKRWNADGEQISVGCPQAIRDYFYHSRSVDIINQLHYNYLIGRKARRCWPRLAWWLIDMCIINAFKLWSIGQQHPSQLNFREQLMFELVKQLPMDQKPDREGPRPRAADALAKDHYPIISQSDRDCKWCSQQSTIRKRSRFVCAECGVHLCIGDCFSCYHSNQ